MYLSIIIFFKVLILFALAFFFAVVLYILRKERWSVYPLNAK